MKFKSTNLSRREQAWLQTAQRIASASTCVKRHGCVIVRSGRVLSVGVNRYINLGLSSRDVVYPCSVHAEVAAIQALHGEAKGATLYVARLSRAGLPAMSKPCPACQKAIIESEIREVVYTR